MFEKFFHKKEETPEVTTEKMRLLKMAKDKEQGDLGGRNKEQTPVSKLRFSMPGVEGSREVGSDTLAKEFIKKRLQEEYPDQEFYRKIEFIEQKDTGPVSTGTGRGGGAEKFGTALPMTGNPLKIVYSWPMKA